MLAGGRYFCRQFDSLPKMFKPRQSVRHCEIAAAKECEKESTKPPENGVVIPPRIERGPTDILRALSATVGHDTMGYPYKYIDDPYLYPESHLLRKIYPVSYEAGKKTADWVVRELPNIFSKKISDPPIKAFCPVGPEKTEDFNENDLIYAIQERNVPQAIQLYNTLKQENCEVSADTKQCLLELVCFYNCKPVPETDEENTWFALETAEEESNEESGNNSWKKGGFAEQLFSEMDPTCPLANSAIIQGMFKFHEYTLAVEHLEKAVKNKIPLSTEAYNMFIERRNFFMLKEGPVYKKILEEMSETGVKPNLGTLNAVLKHILWRKSLDQRWRFAKEAFQALTGLGIEPSLGSYSLLVMILTKISELKEIGHVNASEEFCEILKTVEGMEFEYKHPQDSTFFTSSMFFVKNFVQDEEIATRLFNLYFSNDNAKFITTEAGLRIFLRLYMLLMLEKKPLDFSMQIFRDYFMRFVMPDDSIFRTILEQINLNYAPEYLPEIWRRMKSSYACKSTKLLNGVLKMVHTFSDEETLKILHDTALFSIKGLQDDKMPLEGDINFSDLLAVLVKNKDEENLLKFLKFSDDLQIVNFDDSALETLFEYASTTENSSLIMKCLLYAREANKKLASELAKKAVPLLTGEDKTLAEKFIVRSHRKETGNEKV